MTKEGARLVVLACKLARVEVHPSKMFGGRHTCHTQVRRAVYLAAYRRTGSFKGAGQILGRDHTSVKHAIARCGPDSERLARAINLHMQGESHEGTIPTVPPKDRKHWLQMAADALDIDWRDQYLERRPNRRGAMLIRIASRALLRAGYSTNAIAGFLGFAFVKVSRFINVDPATLSDRQRAKMAKAIDRMTEWIVEEHGQGSRGAKPPCESQ